MCGLFGAIDTLGNGIDTGKIRALALINRDRGTHSLGLFDSSGKAVKHASDPLHALTRPDFADFINHDRRWFLAGHTRHATQGKRTTKNAHPFRYGSIIGAHNGICVAPKRFDVDSQYLFYQLNKHDNDYQAALGNVDGYWGLTWFDGDAFYMQAHDQELWAGRTDDDVIYYSSDASHLEAATGLDDLMELGEGETWKFRAGHAIGERLPDLVAKYSWTTWSKSATNGGKSESAEYPEGYGRSWKEECWASYDEWMSDREYDDLAREFGYTGLEHMMETECIHDYTEAKAWLDDALIAGEGSY